MLERRLRYEMWQQLQNLARVAAERYAPKGHSNQLAGGIRALEPKWQNDKLIGYVISTGASEYAARQHDDELRHAVTPPMQRGFHDYGIGSTKVRRYWSGYEAVKKTAPRFATKFFTRAKEDQRATIVRELRRIIWRERPTI